MNRILSVLLFCITLSPLHAADRPQAGELTPQHERVAGTRVSIVPPRGFEVASHLSGFWDPNSKITLVVVTLPGAYSEVVRGFSDQDALALQGMHVTAAEDRPCNSYQGRLVHIRQVTTEIDAVKLIWVFGDEQTTIMVTGVYHTTQAESWAPVIEQAVLGAVWQPELELDPLEGLPIRITDTAEMRLFSTIGGSLLYTQDGLADEEQTGKPMFMCVAALKSISGDRERLFERRFRQIGPFKRVKTGDMDTITIDGLQGFVGVATAQVRKSDEPRSIYQVMLFEGQSYWAMQGICATDQFESALPNFERMARSFRREQVIVNSTDGLSRLKVPMTWSMRSGLNDAADLEVGHPVGEMYGIVLTEPYTDFAEDYDARRHSESTREWIAVQSANEPKVREFEIGGLPVLLYEFRPTLDGDEFVFWHAVIEGAEHFHQVILYTFADAEEDARDEIERVLHSFEETSPSAAVVEPATDR